MKRSRSNPTKPSQAPDIAGPFAEVGLHGEACAGPPWILGHRGSPLEAPENTLAGLRRALDLGLDGVAYDARACASGEIALLQDESLERTTDGAGALAQSSVVDLSRLDAGGWFSARFRGESLPLVEDALELSAGPERGLARDEQHGRSPTRHLILLRERGLVPDVARALRKLPPGVLARVASARRDECLEARDAGLEVAWIVDRAEEHSRQLARAERLTAVATQPGGWRTESGKEDWRCERWSLSVDEPEDLLEACRLPLAGFTTTEPLRALAARALARLAPGDRGPWPVQAPDLLVEPGARTGLRGDWCGSWDTVARVRNPFDVRVQVTAGVLPRHGAFEIGQVPVRFALRPGEEREVPLSLTGGSWRPGGDPLFYALFRWRKRAGHPVDRLLLDAPLRRVRVAIADGSARRLVLLREAPNDPDASMTVRRRGRHLLVSIENAAGLSDPHAVVLLDGRFHHGGRGVRALLPAGFDTRTGGVPFSCGFVARRDGERVVRRWAGGVPEGTGVGAPGRLLPKAAG